MGFSAYATKSTLSTACLANKASACASSVSRSAVPLAWWGMKWRSPVARSSS